MKRFGVAFGALICTGLVATSGVVAQTRQALAERFAVRLVDDAVDARAQQGPPDDDHVPNSTIGIGQGGAQWVKRSSGFSGELVEAHVATGADGQAVVEFTFTPKGADQFAALTRTNIGRSFVIIFDREVISGPALIGGELTGRQFEMSGYFTDAEAYGLAAEMTAAARTARNRQ